MHEAHIEDVPQLLGAMLEHGLAGILRRIGLVGLLLPFPRQGEECRDERTNKQADNDPASTH
jgi:hypothetical protein